MEKLNIIKDFIPAGMLGTSNPLDYNGVTIHDTGNHARGTGARWHGRYLRSPYALKREASWHFSVDDKDIVQHVPIDKRTWHAGKGNFKTVSIEICVNDDGDLFAATEKAAQLAAALLSHKGLFVPGNVYQHNDWTGKNCPAMLRSGNPYLWSEFLNRIQYFHLYGVNYEENKGLS